MGPFPFSYDRSGRGIHLIRGSDGVVRAVTDAGRIAYESRPEADPEDVSWGAVALFGASILVCLFTLTYLAGHAVALFLYR